LTITNACSDGSGEYSIVETIAETYCVAVTGVEEFDNGSEKACIVVCDELGFCDTTYLNIMITELTSPVAANDRMEIDQGITLTIDVMENDDLDGGEMESISIVTAPENGTVEVIEGKIVYIPNENYCDNESGDTFEYEVCNLAGCDTAQVTVLVKCNGIHVFTGFSPNEDGTNDVFRINGLSESVNHHLEVFNRWGNLVYESDNYKNDWKGTFKGEDLPSGTYFYVITLDDKVLSGYLQLMDEN